jgi:hypothetical protein
MTDMYEDERDDDPDDDLLEEQVAKGYGEDEGEREEGFDQEE